jgi:GH24 family phage-related lysozyme (muramidase)
MRKLNNDSIELIKRWEGFREKAYYDPVGVLTIGYGFTRAILPSLKIGDTITNDDANILLQAKIEDYQIFLSYFNRKFNDNQVGALSSFAWNLGKHIFEIDGWDRNASDEYIVNSMMNYTKANGVVLQGLLNRRREEVALFNEQVENKGGIDIYLINEKNGTKWYVTNGVEVRHIKTTRLLNYYKNVLKLSVDTMMLDEIKKEFVVIM